MSWRIFLWSLLFVVPRIIKRLEYCLVPYIIAENPEMNYKEALKLSRNMMYGNKKHMFFYFLSYAFYFLLSFVLRQIEEGFGALSEIIYTIPYIQVSTTELYIAIRDRYCAANPECGLRDTNKNTNKDPDFWKNPYAIAAVAKGAIDVKKLVTHVFDFDQIQDAYQEALHNKTDALKVMIKVK